jgi:hypothetical protein
MKIQWNKVTWYSKLGAVIVFLFVIPFISFQIGRKYEQVQMSIDTELSTLSPNKTADTDDQEIDNALFALIGKDEQPAKKLEFGKYQIFDGHGQISVENMSRGDLNGDGMQDAFVQELWCAASCGQQFALVLKTETGVQAYKVVPPDIETAGYKQYTIKSTDIENGRVNIVANNGTKDISFAYTLTKNAKGEYSLQKIK